MPASVGKQIIFDYDFLLAVEGESCLYCLSPVTASLALALMVQAGWVTRYQSDIGTPISKDQVERWADNAQGELMTCLEGDQQPTQIELYNQILNNQLMIQNIFNRYDGSTPSSVNPRTPDDFFDGDGSTAPTNALCIALESYVASVCIDLRNRMIVSGLVVSVAVGLSWLIPIAGAFVATGAVAAFVGYNVVEVLQAIEDVAAQRAVICCGTQITGLPVTHDNFQEAFVGCGFTVGSHEDILAHFLYLSTQDVMNYVSFLDTLGTAQILAEADVTGDCSCGCEALIFDWSVAPDIGDWEQATLTDFPAGGFMNGNAGQLGYDFVLAGGAIASGGYTTNDRSLGGILELAAPCVISEVAVTYQAASSGTSGFNVAGYYGGAWHLVGGFASTPAGIPGGYHRFVAQCDLSSVEKVGIVLNAPVSSATQKIELYFG